MKILLVNDDGYKAEGIKTLERVLANEGHDIYVLAPSTEQSGKSHSMTIFSTCYAYKDSDKHFHVDGTPADCIIYGLKSNLLSVKPDLVISGINHGYNLSTDIVYSGTCGAARQAAFYGYKAIAISTNKNSDGNFDFERTAKFLVENMDLFLSQISVNTFLNINVPPSFNGEYRYASVGHIEYDDTFSVKEEDGRIKISNTGCNVIYQEIASEYENDFSLCKKGYASVSYIHLLPSCHLDLDECKK